MADSPPNKSMVIHSQYIKDLSFENPNAPAVYSALGQQGPTLNIILDVRSQHLRDSAYEIVLTLKAKASAEEKTAFLVELDYGGVVSVGDSVPEADRNALLMIEAPRYFFPFARNLLATITREGGFPPLLINPVDFEQFYAQHKQGKPQGDGAPAAQA